MDRIDIFVAVPRGGKEALHTATSQLHSSARSYHRVSKVDCAIADLEVADLIDTPTSRRRCSAG